MGRRGPPATPSALNALRGYPGKRPINGDEPQPALLASITAPRWLTAEARDVWDALAPELHRLGLLTIIDAHALAGACRWWAIYRGADRQLRGLTGARSDTARRNFRIARDAFEAAMGVFARFGVTPSDRVRLHAPQPTGLSHGGDGQRDPHDELAERRRRRQPPATGN